MPESRSPVTLKQLIGFYVPLAATPLMIGLTHSIINAALARLPLPEMSIAVFTVVKGLVMIISSPTLMSLQLVVTYVDDQQSFRLVSRLIWIVGGVLCLFLLLLSYTPLGRLILTQLIGLTGDEKIPLAYTALRITAFLPLVQLLRNVHQGLAIGVHKTRYFIPGIFLRLIFISAFLWFTVKTGLVTGIVAGSLSWVVGIGIEGAFILGSLIYSYHSLNSVISLITDKKQPAPRLQDIVKFFLPLGFMISLGAFLQPVIQSGIAHSHLETSSLAAYGVAWSLITIIGGPLRLLHQLPLVFTDNLQSRNWPRVVRFALATGCLLMVIIAIMALTPAGYWLLNTVIGVTDNIANLAQRVLLPFALFPILRSFRESYWGLLMKQRTTTLIALAKLANLSVVASAITLAIFKLDVQPAVFGASAFILGEAVESSIIWYYAVRYRGGAVRRSL